MGARGYCSESLRFCLKALGFKAKASKSALKQISTAAVRSSFVIWLSRDSRTWDKSFVCEDTLSSLRSLNTAIRDFKAARREIVLPVCTNDIYKQWQQSRRKTKNIRISKFIMTNPFWRLRGSVSNAHRKEESLARSCMSAWIVDGVIRMHTYTICKTCDPDRSIDRSVDTFAIDLCPTDTN